MNYYLKILLFCIFVIFPFAVQAKEAIDMTLTAEEAKQYEDSQHPLIGTVVRNPSYMLAVKGDGFYYGGNSYSEKLALEKAFSGNAADVGLITLGDRLDIIGFPDEGLNVLKVFHPNSEFKVLKLINYGSSFAILEHDGEKYLSPLIIGSEIIWEINRCSGECISWSNLFKECMNSGECIVDYGRRYFYDDNKNAQTYVDNTKYRPPYPSSWIVNTLGNFMAYARDKSRGDFVFDKAHLRSYGKVNILQLADTFLRLEKLNIDRKPAIMQLQNLSWDDFKEHKNKTNKNLAH